MAVHTRCLLAKLSHDMGKKGAGGGGEGRMEVQRSVSQSDQLLQLQRRAI